MRERNICPVHRKVCDIAEVCRLMWCAAGPRPTPTVRLHPVSDHVLTVEQRYAMQMGKLPSTRPPTKEPKEMGEITSRVRAVYEGSSGDATKALYAELTALGPAGDVATNLFRAHKASGRAKKYRGRAERGGPTYRSMAYDRKGWALDNLCRSLTKHAPDLGITWGWKRDPTQEMHNQVLYIDLPTGQQVSFHAAGRGVGPDYPKEWDQVTGEGDTRIIRWIAQLLLGETETVPSPPRARSAVEQQDLFG